MIAIAWAWHMVRAWEIPDVQARREEIFMRVAFATRYGHCSYVEAMEMPIDDLTEYCCALERIVKEEMRPLEEARSRR